MIQNGTLCKYASKIGVMLDFPMSYEPDVTAVAIAEPFGEDLSSCTSRPASLNIPVCCAYSTEIMSSFGNTPDPHDL